MSSSRKSNGAINTLGDMRAKKARSLLIFCRACAATRVLNVRNRVWPASSCKSNNETDILARVALIACRA
jgi:hypothetical protein